VRRSWLSYMPYVFRSPRGILRYRRAIPEPLRMVAGKREYIVSLRTSDDEEAAQRYAKVHLEAEKQFKVWRAQAAGVAVQTTEEDEWAKGLQFLKQNRLEYIPLEQLRSVLRVSNTQLRRGRGDRPRL
jgi:Domain of unknown function (DUF6538)